MPTKRKSLFTLGVVAVALALIAAAVVVGIRLLLDSRRTDLERAIAMAPADSDQLSWTDWTGVRAELNIDPGTTPDADDLAELLDRGFEADLTQTTALGDSAEVLQEIYGFSPATIDWELFSQSEDGAAVMVHLPESTDFDALA